MAAFPNNPWQIAFRNCRQQLAPQEFAVIKTVMTYDDLDKAVTRFRERYRARTVTRALDSINPLMDNLRSLNGVVDTMVQSNPEIAALVWGSIKFVLEVVNPMHKILVVVR